MIYNLISDSFKDIPNSSGVYMIKNILDGKKYIGSSVTIRTRLYSHRSELRNNHHRNAKLQNAFNKYGEKFFVVCVLELCEPIVSTILFLEQKYLDLNPEYNIAKIAGTSYNKNCSEENRTKWRNNKLGTKLSQETKDRISFSNIGRKFSKETKLKISIAAKGVGFKPVLQYTKSGKFLKEFASLGEAGLSLGNKYKYINISLCCRGTRKSASGYKWRFKI